MLSRERIIVLLSVLLTDCILIMLLSVISILTQRAQAQNSIIQMNNMVDSDLNNIISEEKASEEIGDENVSDYESSYNEIIVDIFKSSLAGHVFTSNTLSFSFGENNEFSGFFDNGNRDVSEYIYSIILKNDTICLIIMNPDKTKLVTYEVQADTNENISLYYRPSNIVLPLVKQK